MTPVMHDSYTSVNEANILVTILLSARNTAGTTPCNRFYCSRGDCSLVRRFCSPKVRTFENEIDSFLFRRFCSPKIRKSDAKAPYSEASQTVIAPSNIFLFCKSNGNYFY